MHAILNRDKALRTLCPRTCAEAQWGVQKHSGEWAMMQLSDVHCLAGLRFMSNALQLYEGGWGKAKNWCTSICMRYISNWLRSTNLLVKPCKLSMQLNPCICICKPFQCGETLNSPKNMSCSACEVGHFHMFKKHFGSLHLVRSFAFLIILVKEGLNYGETNKMRAEMCYS